MTPQTRKILLYTSYSVFGYCALHIWKPLTFPLNLPFLPGYRPGEPILYGIRGDAPLPQQVIY